MHKEDEYRQKAAETVGLAAKASSVADKGRLLRLAERWLDLANRAHIFSRPNIQVPSAPDLSAEPHDAE